MRFELTLKDAGEVPAAVAALKERGLASVNVTDTAREIDAVAIARAVLKEDPGLDVMVHLAAKHSASADDAASRAAFIRRLDACVDAGVRKALVVSGHPREPFDSLAALAVLDGEGHAVEAFCVYNPYRAGAEQAEEDARVERKLRYGTVRGVCLQVGMDLDALARGAAHLRSLRYDIAILASVPVPTEAMLARLRTKALFGVSLPEAYFASTAKADAMTRDLVAALDVHDIEPLFFHAGVDASSIALACSLAAK